MGYKIGEVLKLSEAGLNHLYHWDEGKRELAKSKRFEYRCQTRAWEDCISVKPLGKNYYMSYHHSFLTSAES
ncbi:hypothetical protein LCGC14_1452450 [marine sediment metagenome]|uniref:Uncharacterized protein n=1 Tax=marine sediment metagenome TaxID=412755 RepID=A0A0F9JI98_9ZZZZ